MMRTSDNRLNSMKNCKDHTSKEFGENLRIVKLIDERYYELLKEAAKVQQTPHQIANYALAVRSYRALHCAIDDLENGYYEVAMTLIRSVYENMLQMMYFAKYEDEAKKWLYEAKKITQQEIRKKLGKDGSAYQMLSEDYAHPQKIRSLISLTSEGTGKDWKINPFPVYSNYDCLFCLFCWVDFAGGTLKQLRDDFRQALTMSGRVSKVLAAVGECINEMSSGLDEMKKKWVIDGRLKNTFDYIAT